jgi:hypothetical protein
MRARLIIELMVKAKVASCHDAHFASHAAAITPVQFRPWKPNPYEQLIPQCEYLIHLQGDSVMLG